MSNGDVYRSCFPTLNRSHDAGRLFLVDSIPKFTKDADAAVLRLFTQVCLSLRPVLQGTVLQGTILQGIVRLSL